MSLHVHVLSVVHHSDMRKIGSSRGAVTAYPRQLESLIRLSEAHAKMRSALAHTVAHIPGHSAA